MARWIITVMALASLTADTPGQNPRLGGAFVQVRNDKNGKWSEKQWGDELAKMKKADLDLIIVQYVKHVNAKGEPSSILPENNPGQDPLACILKQAQEQKMHVMLGLCYNHFLLEQETLNDPDKLKKILDDETTKSVALAKQLVKDYQLDRNERFVGWFIPVETFNFPENTQEKEERRWPNQLHRYFTAVASDKALLKKPVAISPGVNFNLEPPAVMKEQTVLTRQEICSKIDLLSCAAALWSSFYNHGRELGYPRDEGRRDNEGLH